MFSVTVTSPSTPWRNWGRTESVVPRAVATPADTAEVASIIGGAIERGLTVKPVGAGHSFTGIAVAPGVQLNMSKMRGLVHADTATGRVTLRAGTHLHEIPALLAPYGLAMANLGDVDRQTIAGATSTGTHGTGAGFGGIATQIRGVTLVDGTGTEVRVTDDEPELLAAAALGLGALGVLTEITLQCVPTFRIRADEGTGHVDEVLDSFLDNVAAHDHYEFYWFPHTTATMTKTNTRLPADAQIEGPSRLRRFLDDEVLSNRVLGVVCALDARIPALTPTMNTVVGNALSPRTFVADSHDVFISARRVHFREMEYSIPLEEVPDAVREVRSMIDRRGYRVSFPIEVRAAAADSLMLSTATGRASGYVAVHRYVGDAPDGYFDDVEHIMMGHGGRPHWGKLHTRGSDYLRAQYPRFDEFVSIRDKFDPQRVFANRYLERVLGA
ncbi:D-arabinono-1,4-lactone oxidase [Gordonia jinhuaensis]|uniref:L-gulonolactone oxidase n=1 Tax=Gordonia jinhuaensis TaxID=1517702 RepID=A0A916WSU2_9ACTN|nr:D-arabinono-1,4-lactone oxidase [Gordonia jinhuaensis]GGB29533.1 L-gulonolactone oxidase [Gordonia jinhuaensis]